jgi:hypothetical protein
MVLACQFNIFQKRKRKTATSGSEKIWGDSGGLPEILENLKAFFMAHMWP